MNRNHLRNPTLRDRRTSPDLGNQIAAIYAGYRQGADIRFDDETLAALGAYSIDVYDESPIKSTAILRAMNPALYAKHFLERLSADPGRIEQTAKVMAGPGLAKCFSTMMQYSSDHMGAMGNLVERLKSYEVVADIISKRFGFRQADIRDEAIQLMNKLGDSLNAFEFACERLEEDAARPTALKYMRGRLGDRNLMRALINRSTVAIVAFYAESLIPQMPPVKSIGYLVSALRETDKCQFAYRTISKVKDHVHLYRFLIEELDRTDSGSLAEELLAEREPDSNLMQAYNQHGFRVPSRHPALKNLFIGYGAAETTIKALCTQLKFDDSRALAYDILYSFRYDAETMDVLHSQARKSDKAEYVQPIFDQLRITEQHDSRQLLKVNKK